MGQPFAGLPLFARSMMRFFFACLFLLAAPAVAAPPAVTAPQLEGVKPVSAKRGVLIDTRPALVAARTAMQEGNFEKAERLYKVLIKAMPHLTDVRLEYAAAARHAGEERRAREILVPVDVDALQPGQRSAYRNIVWGERAFDVSFSPRVMFDSNLNSGSRNNTIVIGGTVFNLAEESLASDSGGAGGTLAMQALWMPTREIGLGITNIIDGDFYEDSDFNDVRMSLAAGPRFLMGPALLRLNALAGTRYFGGDRLESHYGGQAALTVNIAPATPLTFSASRREFDGQTRTGIERDRSHDTFAATLVTEDLLPWKGATWLNVSVETENWARNVEDNNAYRGGFGFSLPKTEYVTPHVMMNATRRLYDNAIPLLGVRRAEWRLEPSLRLDLDAVKFAGGVPYVQYTYIDNISNVSLTDYDQHRITAGLTIKAW